MSTQPEQPRGPARYTKAAIVAAPLGIFIIGVSISALIATKVGSTSLNGKALSGLLGVSSALLLFVASALGAIAVALVTIYRQHGDLKEAGKAFGIAVVLTAFMLILAKCSPSDAKLLAQLGLPDRKVDFLASVIMFANIFAAMAGVTVVVAVAYLAPGPTPRLSTEMTDVDKRRVIDEAGQDLAVRVRYLKYLLAVGAAVLFTGLVLMKAWRDWAVNNFADTQKVSDSKILTEATLNYDALFFTIILAAIFLPMMLWLRSAGTDLAKVDPALAKDSAAQDRWLLAHGIKLSINETAQRAIAIASPFLAAPAVTGLKKLLEFMPAG